MYYITVKQPPRYRQMTFEEFLSQENVDIHAIGNETCTRVYTVDVIPEKYASKYSEAALTRRLLDFNRSFSGLFSVDKRTLYKTFYVEKRGKGMKNVLKAVFEQQGRYVPCDAGRACAVMREAYRPAIAQHGCAEHEAVMERVGQTLRDGLSGMGFAPERIDAAAALKAGYRRIDAPTRDLMNALRTLKGIFEEDFGALYHTSAFAYIHGRSCIDAVKKHQQNESRWFAKFDLTDFFGSTTQAYVEGVLSKIFPFSAVLETETGGDALRKALSLGFLNGGLPQGTPLSPTLTNIMMIPIDYELFNGFRRNGLVYTRYADDFLVSARFGFDPKRAAEQIKQTLRKFGAPFSLNESKTRYGSSAGSNWNLGLMLNASNDITIGYQNKRRFRAMLTSYVLDRKNGARWDRSDVQVLEGYRNYYRMVEPEIIDGIVAKLGEKFGVDIVEAIRTDLRP